MQLNLFFVYNSIYQKHYSSFSLTLLCNKIPGYFRTAAFSRFYTGHQLATLTKCQPLIFNEVKVTIFQFCLWLLRMRTWQIVYFGVLTCFYKWKMILCQNNLRVWYTSFDVNPPNREAFSPLFFKVYSKLVYLIVHLIFFFFFPQNIFLGVCVQTMSWEHAETVGWTVVGK